jgi:NTE family protein
MANVRLILSGGSARGILEAAGAVNALADRGHEISVGAGTSAGGIIMGALAAGRAPKELKQIVLDTDFSQFISTGWRSWWRLARKGALSDGKALLKFLLRITRNITFKDALFDVRITSANYTLGQEQVFTRETDPDMPLGLAMRITSAMPMGFSAVEYKGHWFKDGGVYENVPIETGLRSIERTVIFALADSVDGVQNNEPWKADVGLVKEASRSIGLMLDANMEASYRQAPGDAIKVFSDGLGVPTLKFNLSRDMRQRLFDHGYELMAKGLIDAGM